MWVALVVVGLLAAPATFASGAGHPAKGETEMLMAPGGWEKTDTFSAHLLLPLYEVDISNPFGATTLFAVRNEAGTSVDISIEYFEIDVPQAAQGTELVTLGPKEIRTVNMRFVPNLEVDPDDVSRGYVVISGPDGASLQGDYFQVTPAQDFASGFRLLNTDTQSNQNDLCNLFSMRFLNGGGFDSGTEFTIWLDLDQVPTGDTPVLDIFAYNEAGGDPILGREFFADTTVFKVTAEELLQPFSQDFGAIEFQFRNGVIGHVTAIQSADNRYSVGLEAACGDF